MLSILTSISYKFLYFTCNVIVLEIGDVYEDFNYTSMASRNYCALVLLN